MQAALLIYNTSCLNKTKVLADFFFNVDLLEIPTKAKSISHTSRRFVLANLVI